MIDTAIGISSKTTMAQRRLVDNMSDKSTRNYLILTGIVLIVWLIAIILVAPTVYGQSPPVSKHLFVDDALVDKTQSSNYTFAVNPPTNAKRIISADKPWEDLGFYHLALFVRDFCKDPTPRTFEGGCYGIAYPAWNTVNGIQTAYASSSDGVNWYKPSNIDNTKFDGDNSNLMTMPVSIEYSGYDPKTKRYLKTGNDEQGYFGLTHWSLDGIKWTEYKPAVRLITEAPYGVDGTRDFLYDERTGKYLWFLRGWYDSYRSMHLSVSDSVDKLQWTDAEKPLLKWPNEGWRAITTEVSLLAQSDAQDWPGWDNGRKQSVQLYRWLPYRYDDIYIAWPWLFHLLFPNRPVDGRAGTGNDGDFDSEFAVSRDGINWTRYRTPTYLPRGEYDGQQMYMVLSANQPLVIGDKIYEYFLALPKSKRSAWIDGEWGPYLDGGERQKKWLQMDQGGIYMAEQRLDGFVSLQPANAGKATVVTLPMTPAGARLRVNHKGGVTVSVLDGTKTLATQRLTGDNLRVLVADDLPSKSLRLKFEMDAGAKVYAFEFDNPGAPTNTPVPPTTTKKPTATPPITNTPIAPTATKKPTATPTHTATPRATNTPTKQPTSTATKALLPTPNASLTIPTSVDVGTTSARLRYDEDALYLTATVVDSDIVAPIRCANGGACDLWRYDSIEFFVDAKGDSVGSRDDARAWMGPDDVQVIVSAAGEMLTTHGNADYSWDYGWSGTPSYSARQIRNGYVVDIALRWADLGIDPAIGHRLAVNVVQNDNDAGTYRSYSLSGVRANQNAALWPRAILAEVSQPTATPTAMPGPDAIDLLENGIWRFEQSASGAPDGYRIVVSEPNTTACWHYDIPGDLAGKTVTLSGDLFRSFEMGSYAPYLALQVLREGTWAYNVGGTLRHTQAPGTWQTVQRDIDIAADADAVRTSFCVWRAEPGVVRARDMRLEALP